MNMRLSTVHYHEYTKYGKYQTQIQYYSKFKGVWPFLSTVKHRNNGHLNNGMHRNNGQNAFSGASK